MTKGKDSPSTRELSKLKQLEKENARLKKENDIGVPLFTGYIDKGGTPVLRVGVLLLKSRVRGDFGAFEPVGLAWGRFFRFGRFLRA